MEIACFQQESFFSLIILNAPCLHLAKAWQWAFIFM